MKYRTNLKTLKRVYNLMKDMGIESLMIGKSKEIEFDVVGIVEKIMTSDVLNEFCQTVTGDTKTDFEEKEPVEIEEVMLGFFTATAQSFKGLKTIQAQLAQAQNKE